MSVRLLGRHLSVVGLSALIAVGLAAPASAAPTLPHTEPKLFAGSSSVENDAKTMKAADVPTPAGPKLESNARLQESHRLVSPTGQHSLVLNGMTGERDSVVITGPTGDPVVLARNSSTNTSVTNTLVMQGDGNLVLLVDGKPTWWTGTQGNAGAYAMLQNDRNFVVYSKTGAPLWQSRTVMTNMSSFWLDNSNAEDGYLDANWLLQSPDRSRRLVMQGDGNLVLLRGNTPLWSSRTNGNANAYAKLQSDGNLVIYSSSNRVLFNANRRLGAVVHANALTLQNDGNLVLYTYYPNGTSQVRWSTGTANK